MPRVYLAERKVKVQMINEILKQFDDVYRRSELESKTLSEVKYIYYDCRANKIGYSNN